MSTTPQEVESPVISLSDDISIIRELQDKFVEYTARLEECTGGNNRFKAPELIPDLTSILYKIAVLERLLTQGKVITHTMGRDLQAKYGRFSALDFDNACGVIDTYTKKGVKGSGLSS